MGSSKLIASISAALIVSIQTTLLCGNAIADDSKVKQGAKDVGAGVTEAAREVGHGTKKATKEVGKGVSEAAREVGHGTKKAGKEVGKAVSEAARETGHAFRDGAKEVKKAVTGKPPSTKQSTKKDKK